MEIHTAVVSQIVPAIFADLAEAADLLPGADLTVAGAHLKVEGRLGAGLAGAIRFGGTLRTSTLLPAVKVEVAVAPWSAGRSEIAVHPLSDLGSFDSIRARRFFKAASTVLPLLIGRLSRSLPSEALELAA